MYPNAARSAAAMGRSNRFPSFRTSAGARLTVILLGGRLIFVFLIAVFTRSWASLTWDDRYPTILNTGRPLLTSASTRTGTQFTPQIAADITLLNIQILLSPAAGQKYPSGAGVHILFLLASFVLETTVEPPGKKCGNPLSDLLLLYHIFFCHAMADWFFYYKTQSPCLPANHILL